MSWSNVIVNRLYESFEDPVTNQIMSKKDFDEIYGLACIELFDNDTEIKVTLFFEENPMIQGEWRFVDEDARLDIYELAVEMKLIVSHKEICEGETVEAKRRRLEKEKSRYKYNDPPAKRVIKANTLGEKLDRIKVIDERLAENISGKQRKRMEREKRGILKSLSHSV